MCGVVIDTYTVIQVHFLPFNNMVYTMIAGLPKFIRINCNKANRESGYFAEEVTSDISLQ